MNNEIATGRYTRDVNGSQFEWDLNEGTFTYEGDGVILFWINTAFKVFMDSIEEIAGNEEARLVLETAGYRTGENVSGFYHESMGNVEQIVSTLPNIYLTAGWGVTTIEKVSKEEKTAVVRVRNSWEYKLNIVQEKTIEGTFIPGHWAGVFSGLFGESVWYRVVKSQIEGDDYSEYVFSPSSITPKENILSMIKEKNREEIAILERKVNERTEELQNLITELSSPIIPVLDNIVVIPLIGRFNDERSEELMTKTLNQLPDYQAHTLILDLTGIYGVDEYTIDLMHNLVRACRLLGVDTIFVGVSPKLSMLMVQSRADLEGMVCLSTLQHGIHYALAQDGLHIIGKK
ncbi:STAS domain-containing protein [Pseudalkalibacillus hwajinpoensis]|uniref:STAS domain-containing protein n=1 Tax=Guptibacillus hwajinpoensis TaxID=208199 RepID=A0A4U1MKV6_9BACL|nr:STAS domain-containing protein [Pseudalkalibacillus hwajinpoensis]TKD72079.1 STAS domain-containing protein [Pseudalkalibacillus hwajinpoensis]